MDKTSFFQKVFALKDVFFFNTECILITNKSFKRTNTQLWLYFTTSNDFFICLSEFDQMDNRERDKTSVFPRNFFEFSRSMLVLLRQHEKKHAGVQKNV
jgi:hypothetical protein